MRAMAARQNQPSAAFLAATSSPSSRDGEGDRSAKPDGGEGSAQPTLRPGWRR